jgi:polyphosphate kinase
MLESAGQAQRPLPVRLADVQHLLALIDRLYGVHLADVQRWFERPEAAGRSLHTALPHWTEVLLTETGALLREQLLPGLAGLGAEVLPVEQVDEAQRAWLHSYFTARVYPLLTPLAVDPGRPFPYISSDSLNLLVELHRPDASYEARTPLFARVKIPPTTPRLVALPMQSGVQDDAQPTRYVGSADLVRFFVHHLFTGVPVRQVYLFRVVRGETAWPGGGRRSTSRRRRHEDQPVVRLDVERRMAGPVLHWLMEHLHLPAHGVIHHDSLLELTYLPAAARLADGVMAGAPVAAVR